MFLFYFLPATLGLFSRLRHSARHHNRSARFVSLPGPPSVPDAPRFTLLLLGTLSELGLLLSLGRLGLLGRLVLLGRLLGLLGGVG